MSDFEYDIHLPKEQRSLLLKVVEKAKKCNVLSVTYFLHKPNDPPYHLEFVFNSENEIVNLPEDPIPGFEVLGFVKIIDEYRIFLTPKIFKWADYERKNCLMKWWSRLPSSIHDIMLVMAFTLSLILTILQIYEKLNTFLGK